MLTPRGVRLVGIDTLQSGLATKNKSDERASIVAFERILELRQETLTFQATFEGEFPGQSTVELRGISDNSGGEVSAVEVINVRS